MSRDSIEEKIDEEIRDLPKLNAFLQTADRNKGLEKKLRDEMALEWKIRERMQLATKTAHVSAHDLIIAMEEMAGHILECDVMLRQMTGIVFHHHVKSDASEIKRRIQSGKDDSCPFRF